jgi:hypothetical protein
VAPQETATPNLKQLETANGLIPQACFTVPLVSRPAFQQMPPRGGSHDLVAAASVN